ncbi:MAG: hypothetical protein AB7M12_07465 [Hyphomonadaceae bacterium]
MEAIFKGASGRLHRFWACDPRAALPAGPAVYAFARPGVGGRGWVPLFLSRTANLAQRMASHEIWDEALRLGATHVLIHQSQARDAREAVEADLLAVLRPVLNEPYDGGRAAAPASAQVIGLPSLGATMRRAAGF